jgi:hypothetical protein
MSKPVYEAFTAREYREGKVTKTYWCKIGAAWPMKSGDGLTIRLDALPIDGQISLFTPKEKIPAEPEG